MDEYCEGPEIFHGMYGHLITGKPCTVYHVPDWLKDTEKAAGSDYGLSQRFTVCKDCADMLETEEESGDETEEID